MYDVTAVHAVRGLVFVRRILLGWPSFSLRCRGVRGRRRLVYSVRCTARAVSTSASGRVPATDEASRRGRARQLGGGKERRSARAASGREDLIEVHSVQTRARSRTCCGTRCRCAPFRSRTLSAPRARRRSGGAAEAAANRKHTRDAEQLRRRRPPVWQRIPGSARAPSPRGNQLVPRPALAVSSVTSAPRPDKRFSSVSGQLARSVGRRRARAQSTSGRRRLVVARRPLNLSARAAALPRIIPRAEARAAGACTNILRAVRNARFTVGR